MEEAWYNLASSKLSLASAMSSVTWLMIFSVAEAAEWRSGGNEVGTIGGISWGERPSWSWKPEYPVEVLIVFMMQKWIHGKALTQPFWFWPMWNQIDWLTVLFVCPLAPSVCGWYTDDIFNLTPVSLFRAFQKQETKSLSLSETKLRGKPLLQYQLSNTSRATSSAKASVQVGMIWMSEPRQSVIVKMQLEPWSLGRGPMKSSATLSPCSSGIGSGCNSPGAFVVHDLLHWQSVHNGT